MSRVQFLRSKRNVLQSVVHRFLLKYRPGFNDIFLFFEGKDDPSFYLPEIRKRISSSRGIHTFQCDGKGTVLSVHSKIMNRIDNKHRCLFFVDKDLDNYLGLRKPRHKNIFMTGPYSVENYICTEEALHILWTELLHLLESDARYYDIKRYYKVSYDSYVKSLRPVMAWILKHRENYPTNRNKLNLNNITFYQLFDMDSNTLIVRRKNGAYKYIIDATNMQAHPVSVAEVKEKTKILNLQLPKDWGRGKFEAGWFAAFIDKVISFLQATRTAIQPKISLKLQISASNLLDVFAGRIACPQDLVLFLNFNQVSI
jgi:hypothetical protein